MNEINNMDELSPQLQEVTKILNDAAYKFQVVQSIELLGKQQEALLPGGQDGTTRGKLVDLKKRVGEELKEAQNQCLAIMLKLENKSNTSLEVN